MLVPILAAASALAAPVCTHGTWITEAGGQAIYKLEISTSPRGVSAVWTAPIHFEFDGDTFSNVQNAVVRTAATSARPADNDLVLHFDDQQPTMHVRCGSEGHLTIRFEGGSFQPFDFIKVSGSSARLGPWDIRKHYTREFAWPTNPEMTRIFDEDQADRRSTSIDWAIVGPRDDKRLQRTKELLDAGALKSGDDFFHAAFIFQHGSEESDYLKAHLLAMIAMGRGKSGAVWIASATLDRYLQKIGKAQVLGTQFKVSNDAAPTQEPYDRNLVSDAMRLALHVPPLAEQERQRESYAHQQPAAKRP